MQKLESYYGKTSPVLIHSDLKLVDAELNDLNITYSSRQLLDLQKYHPLRFASQMLSLDVLL